MARYLYNKYNVEQLISYIEPDWDTEQFVSTNWSDSLYKSYYFNSSENKFYGSGEKWNFGDAVRQGDVAYGSFYGYGMDHVLKYVANSNGEISMYTKDYISTISCDKFNRWDNTTVSDIQGSLIQANIVAENGTYPINGKHTDGYWYVRGSLYNTAPTIPGTFTSPTVGSSLKGGDTVILTFGRSTDAEGDAITYELSESVDGASYGVITTITTNTYSRAIQKRTSVKWRVRARDSQGAYSGYRESLTYTISNNTAPVISGIDGSLGDKTTTFSINYQVNDVDTANALTVTERLNRTILRTLSNAPKNTDIQLDITKELFDALLLNSTNTIQIEVNDGAGGIAYRNYTFTKSNSAPIISGIDADLGVITEIPSQVYQVSDNEGDAVTITEKIDDLVIRTFEATASTDYTITIPILEWFKLSLGQHTLKIEALDARGGKSIRTYTFTRADDKIKMELKTPFVTDMKASKLLISPTWVIPTGASAKVEACNNAFDELPTWEDITGQVLINRHYNFTNAVKTAEKWGINIRFTLEKGTATGQVILDGFGGAFE